jgi:hypothetical protein
MFQGRLRQGWGYDDRLDLRLINQKDQQKQPLDEEESAAWNRQGDSPSACLTRAIGCCSPSRISFLPSSPALPRLPQAIFLSVVLRLAVPSGPFSPRHPGQPADRGVGHTVAPGNIGLRFASIEAR